MTVRELVLLRLARHDRQLLAPAGRVIFERCSPEALEQWWELAESAYTGRALSRQTRERLRGVPRAAEATDAIDGVLVVGE